MAEHPTGIPILLEPLVTRVLAPNPSPFTYTGTQSHVVGDRDVAVIDPGPDDPAHLDALTRAIAGRPVVAILITHHHRDHSPASRPLARLTGAPIVGAAPFAADYQGGQSDAAFDRDYAPDRGLAEGEGKRRRLDAERHRDAGPYLQPSRLCAARDQGAVFGRSRHGLVD
ncbi:hypothetical protein GCM10020258_32170 [Sphingomonas yabuuchiae]